MSRSIIEYLEHIKTETDFLLRHSESLTYELFLSDEILRRAFSRSLEIIGEATKNIPEQFRQKYPDVDWRGIGGLRDKLIHHYFGIDYEIVWDILIHEIPELNKQIDAIIRQEQQE